MSEIDFRVTSNPIERTGDRPVTAADVLSAPVFGSTLPRLTQQQAEVAKPSTISIPTLTLHDSRLNTRAEYTTNSPAARTYLENRASVVRINTADARGDGTGSGFVVSQDGLIATGYHVVKDAESIVVRMENGKTYKAKVYDLDPSKDLALLLLEREKSDEKFQPASLDVSSTNAVARQRLLALGYPNNVEAIHLSEVKPKAREQLHRLPIIGGYLEGEDKNRIVVRTEGNVAKGNSGGPVFDPETGKVIGVVNLSNRVDTYFNPVEDLLAFLAKPRGPSVARTLDVGISPIRRDNTPVARPGTLLLVPTVNPYYAPGVISRPNDPLKPTSLAPLRPTTTGGGGLATRIQELGRR
ncbi:MAG: serine protease [Candidatus Obscuribacterales bacterium]|nr:serine protease [Candidatus Obscuribacterales bacterium]